MLQKYLASKQMHTPELKIFKALRSLGLHMHLNKCIPPIQKVILFCKQTRAGRILDSVLRNVLPFQSTSWASSA